jgi:hypothetical protein
LAARAARRHRRRPGPAARGCRRAAMLSQRHRQAHCLSSSARRPARSAPGSPGHRARTGSARSPWPHYPRSSAPRPLRQPMCISTTKPARLRLPGQIRRSRSGGLSGPITSGNAETLRRVHLPPPASHPAPTSNDSAALCGTDPESSAFSAHKMEPPKTPGRFSQIAIGSPGSRPCRPSRRCVSVIRGQASDSLREGGQIEACQVCTWSSWTGGAGRFGLRRPSSVRLASLAQRSGGATTSGRIAARSTAFGPCRPREELLIPRLHL